MIFAVYDESCYYSNAVHTCTCQVSSHVPGEKWTSLHLSTMPASQVHPTTLVIPVIHTVCVVGGGVRAAAFTLTLFAGGGFHAMRQRLQSELNHLSAEDP